MPPLQAAPAAAARRARRARGAGREAAEVERAARARVGAGRLGQDGDADAVARAESRPAIWLRLDGNDNDPLVLLRCLAVALDQALGVDPEILELLQLRSPPLVERVLPGLGGGGGRRAAVRARAGRRPARAEPGGVGARRSSCSRTCPRARRWSSQRGVDPPLPLGQAEGERASSWRCASRSSPSTATRRWRCCASTRPGERRRWAGGGRRWPRWGRDTVAALLEATEGWATGLYLASQTAQRPVARRVAARGARRPARYRRLPPRTRCSSVSPPTCSSSCSRRRSSTS